MKATTNPQSDVEMATIAEVSRATNEVRTALLDLFDSPRVFLIGYIVLTIILGVLDWGRMTACLPDCTLTIFVGKEPLETVVNRLRVTYNECISASHDPWCPTFPYYTLYLFVFILVFCVGKCVVVVKYRDHLKW